MSEIKHSFIRTNGIKMHVAETGDGFPVVFCHGFPEMWYSWRHQMKALAEAGFTQFANLKTIYLLRTENGKQEKYPFNYKEVIKGNHPEQNIALKPGDTVVVP